MCLLSMCGELKCGMLLVFNHDNTTKIKSDKWKNDIEINLIKEMKK